MKQKDQSVRPTKRSHSFARNSWKMDIVLMRRDANLPMDSHNSAKTTNTIPNTKLKNVVASRTTSFVDMETVVTLSMCLVLLKEITVESFKEADMGMLKWN